MLTTEGVVENIDAMFYDDYLPMIEHYGVKGMHWGIRNSETLARYSRERSAKRQKKQEIKSLKTEIKTSKKNRKKEADLNKLRRKQIKNDRKYANKNRALLSDEELNKRISRLQKERQLHLLTEQELAPGKYAVKKALTNVGTEVFKEEIKKEAKDKAIPTVKRKVVSRLSKK